MLNPLHFASVTSAYWAFTVTDGALRMLVLLHFYELGYSPFQLALLFLLYEFFGIVTNLFGGWLGARMGLKLTLEAGLLLQVVALMALSFLPEQWSMTASIVYVMGVQSLSGIAKDLTKMSSKSSVKLLSKEQHLFGWVAVLTGSKNTLKGVGFFVGGGLLAWVGFAPALWLMSAVLLVVAIMSSVYLPKGWGQINAKPKFQAMFSKSSAINRLSAARLFLFGARDVWFVVALPVYMSEVMGWSFTEIGAFMAAWVIAYGFVQAATPKFLRQSQPASRVIALAALLLMGSVLMIVIGRVFGLESGNWVLFGLMLFGLLFAINSSLHSYFILAYSEHDDVSMNVGFYYMANAGGRLIGTLLSGWVYVVGGIMGALWTAAAFLLLSALIAYYLPDTTHQNASDTAAS